MRWKIIYTREHKDTKCPHEHPGSSCGWIQTWCCWKRGPLMGLGGGSPLVIPWLNAEGSSRSATCWEPEQFSPTHRWTMVTNHIISCLCIRSRPLLQQIDGKMGGKKSMASSRSPQKEPPLSAFLVWCPPARLWEIERPVWTSWQTPIGRILLCQYNDWFQSAIFSLSRWSVWP